MEAEVITKFLVDLVNATSDCVQAISDQCLAKGLITRSTYDRVLESWGTRKEKARSLVLAVQNSTETDGSCFDILLEILDEQLPPASKQKLLLEMSKERTERANSCKLAALVPVHSQSQQLSTELAVPLTVTSLQCIQQQSSLLERFENSVGRLAHSSAQKNQFEREVQSQVEEIDGLKTKLVVLENQLEANSLANEKEISSTKRRISACEMEMGGLRKRMEELKGIIEEESMQVKRGRNMIKIGTKMLFDQIVQQNQQEIKRSGKKFEEILKSKEQAEQEATILRRKQEEANAKVRELELKLARQKKEFQSIAGMGLSFPTSETTTPAQKTSVQQSSAPSAESGSTMPSLKDLVAELNEIGLNWDMVGIILGIDPDILDALKEDNQNNSTRCLIEMLKILLKNVSPPPSWSVIAEALQSIGYPVIKERLKMKYCNESTVFNQLTKYADKWREIGINLGFTECELDDIKARLPSDGPTSFLHAMLLQWMQWKGRGSEPGYPKPEHLTNALRQAGLAEAANNLQF